MCAGQYLTSFRHVDLSNLSALFASFVSRFLRACSRRSAQVYPSHPWALRLHSSSRTGSPSNDRQHDSSQALYLLQQVDVGTIRSQHVIKLGLSRFKFCATSLAAAADVFMDRPSSFVVTFNVSKRHNVGTIARACTAFDVAALCLVGSREYNSFGSHGSDNYVDMIHFNTLDDCCTRLRDDYRCSIVGAVLLTVTCVSACCALPSGSMRHKHWIIFNASAQ